MCLAKRHNTVTPVRLEPLAPRSPVKHYTNEPPCSLVLRPKENFKDYSRSLINFPVLFKANLNFKKALMIFKYFSCLAKPVSGI